MVAVFGLALAANAQADQCKLEGGNGGYIDAYIGTNRMDAPKPSVTITTTPSVEQPSDGKVLCKVTYIRADNGEKESVTGSVKFSKKGSCSHADYNTIYLDHKASRIVSIEIWGAECKSASRPW